MDCSCEHSLHYPEMKRVSRTKPFSCGKVPGTSFLESGGNSHVRFGSKADILQLRKDAPQASVSNGPPAARHLVPTSTFCSHPPYGGPARRCVPIAQAAPQGVGRHKKWTTAHPRIEGWVCRGSKRRPSLAHNPHGFRKLAHLLTPTLGSTPSPVDRLAELGVAHNLWHRAPILPKRADLFDPLSGELRLGGRTASPFL
jgi:hypothetical protein